ncbi:MAG TPA: hypothetical protein ENH01_04230 [Nitrospirae bacterium]|nr:hypothetical protein [Nitrospirota bacterium]
MLIDLIVFKEAGGNPTGLITTNHPFETHQDIGRKIIDISKQWDKSPPVEQVAFLLKREYKFLKFRMAGGESCGNALLAMGAYANNMEDGESKVEMILGSNHANFQSEKVAAYTDQGVTWMDFNLDKLAIENISNATIIHLDGISHAVVPASYNNSVIEEDEIKKILESFGILSKPAAGIMYVKDKDNQIDLNPFVHVKALNTCINETACGSGSIAAGIWKVLKENNDIDNFHIIQKTGKPIYVSIKRSGNDFLAKFGTEVSLIFKGSVEIDL